MHKRLNATLISVMQSACGNQHLGRVPIPVAVCSWYLSMSMWRLVVKKSSLAVSLWYMDTISFFCLDSEEFCLSKLMLKERGK